MAGRQVIDKDYTEYGSPPQITREAPKALSNKTGFKPLFDRVLIEPIIKDMTDSGLHIPESAKTISHQDPKGKVLAVGDEVKKVKVGDVVYFDDRAVAMMLNGKFHVNAKEEEIYGIYAE